MKKCFLCLLFLLAAALPGRCDGIDSWFAGLDTTAFLLVDKQKLTLTLVAPGGRIERDYRIACGENYGNKTKKGDHRTPEGRFPINQLLNAAGLSHDFGDGKGPVANAYGPWFLRLDVPGFITIGIHGTHLPESIGSRATEGCVRLRNEDILDLKERVAVGMPVVILPDSLTQP
ncbi:MAG: L,D-transpeptidase, partial [Bacteroidales bacterium]|nr:L,D-transpeptidase [Bacteroidales bacterium]